MEEERHLWRLRGRPTTRYTIGLLAASEIHPKFMLKS